MGDGMMVLFPDGAAAAINAAEAAQLAITGLNRAPELADDPIILRASIEYGQVILGTVGHKDRFDTTVIADPVNVAARLQEWCRTLSIDVLATEGCQPDEQQRPYARCLGNFSIRGRNQPVAMYEQCIQLCRDTDETRKSELFDRVECRNRGEWLDAIEPLRLYLKARPDDKVAQWLLTDTADALKSDRRCQTKQCSLSLR